MKLDSLGGLIKQNPLFNAYISDFSRVEKFFSYPGDQIKGFREHGQWLAENYRLDRSRLVEILLPYNRELGCTGKTLENLERLKGGTTLAVVTGQQAGVLTGPLYTLYKAITAIQLAKEMEEQLGVPVVPVFWVAGEDHDYQEINHIYALKGVGAIGSVAEKWGSKQPDSEKIVLAGKVQGKPPVSNIPVEDRVFRLIDEVAKLVDGLPYAGNVADMLRATATGTENLSQWFGTLLTRLLGKYGLIMVDPMLPGVRELMSPFFHEVVAAGPDLVEAVDKGGQVLETSGFTTAFTVDQTFTGLFTIISNQRVPLLYQREKYYAHGLANSWSRQELEQAMSFTPQLFSTSAVLRPVVQDKLFPTLAYVGGPGEVAYFAQLKRVFRLFGQRMPVVFPRKSYLLIEPGVAKVMDRFSLTLEDLAWQQPEKLVLDIANRLEGTDFHQSFDRVREIVAREQTNLVAKLAESIPDIAHLGPGNLDRILLQFNYLEDKSRQKVRKKHREGVNEFYFALSSLFPKGRPQERMFNVMPFLAGYGREWVDWLVTAGQGKGFNYSYSNQAIYF